MLIVDRLSPGATEPDELEAELTRLFALELPTPLLARLDAQLTQATSRRSGSGAAPARRRAGRRAGIVALLAAALVIGGANGRLQALYVAIAGPFGVPWERGVELNQSQTVDGYRVTLDRAYADATRLGLAISVVDEQRRSGTTQLEAFSAVVTDDAGEYGGISAASAPDGPYAAVNIAWKTPARLPLPDGPRAFHVVLPFIQVRDDSIAPPDADAVGWSPWHRKAGPWEFDFTLDVDGGTTINPNAVVDANGIRLRVVRVIAARSIVRVEVRTEGDTSDAGWMPIGEVQHRGQTLPINVVGRGNDGTIALMTEGGVSDPSGDWTITLRRPSNEAGDPWVVHFSAP